MADPAADAVSAVRFLVGDPDQGSGTTTLLTTAEIEFALDQTGDAIYPAAAVCARALSARYARRADTKFETVETKYSQLRDSFAQLARQLDFQAKKRGALGKPEAGGISVSDMDTVRANADRAKPYFSRGMFNNPPLPNE